MGWNSGVFELPAPEFTDRYKLLVINFLTKNPSSDDSRLREQSLLQLCLFMPLDIMRLLPSCSVYEDTLLNAIKTNFDDDRSILEGNKEFRKIVFMSILSHIK